MFILPPGPTRAQGTPEAPSRPIGARPVENLAPQAYGPRHDGCGSPGATRGCRPAGSGARRGIASGLAPDTVLVVEDEAGLAAGFVMTGPEHPLSTRSGTRGELWAINIAPESWGRGLGRLLC